MNAEYLTPPSKEGEESGGGEGEGEGETEDGGASECAGVHDPGDGSPAACRRLYSATIWSSVQHSPPSVSMRLWTTGGRPLSWSAVGSSPS